MSKKPEKEVNQSESKSLAEMIMSKLSKGDFEEGGKEENESGEFDLDPKYQPNSAFYVFLRYRDQKRSSLELAMEILEKTGVALTPGVDFGPGGEGFLRFSYANSQENLERALKRIKEIGLI